MCSLIRCSSRPGRWSERTQSLHISRLGHGEFLNSSSVPTVLTKTAGCMVRTKRAWGTRHERKNAWLNSSTNLWPPRLDRCPKTEVAKDLLWSVNPMGNTINAGEQGSPFRPFSSGLSGYKSPQAASYGCYLARIAPAKFRSWWPLGSHTTSLSRRECEARWSYLSTKESPFLGSSPGINPALLRDVQHPKCMATQTDNPRRDNHLNRRVGTANYRSQMPPQSNRQAYSPRSTLPRNPQRLRVDDASTYRPN